MEMYPELVDVTAIAGERVHDRLIGWGSERSEHLAATNEDHELIVFSWDSNVDWRATNITTITGMSMAGPLTRWRRPGLDYTTEFLAGRNEVGDLVVVYSYDSRRLAVWEGRNAFALDLSGLSSEARFSGELASWQSPFGAEYVAGPRPDGHLLIVRLSPLACIDLHSLTGEYVSGPVVAWQVRDGPDVDERVAGVTPDGRVVIFVSGATPTRSAWAQPEVIDVSQQTGVATRSPLVAWQTPESPGVVEHLAGRTDRGEVIVYSSTTGARRWQAVDVSARTGVPLAGPLTAWQTWVPDGVVDHLAALNSDGEITVLVRSSDNDWQAWNLSKPMDYPALVDGLTSWQVSDGAANVEHLAGRDSAGRVLLWFWLTGSLRTLRLHAVEVANDDGTHQVGITPNQVRRWAEQANRVFASAGVQFLFVPETSGPDWSTVRSTVLNSLQVRPGRPGEQDQEQGNAVARSHRGKVTVLFRAGPPPRCTSRGFADIGCEFVIMPGFDDTVVCGHQDINQFSHQLGHYLGLDHTFKQTFPNEAAAARALSDAGGDPALAFDGDGLADTPPDPLIIEGTDAEPYQCQRSTVTLNDQVLVLPRRNIMARYDTPVPEITAQQTQRVDESLLMRAARGLVIGTP
jgi:hypothetical protein